MAIVTDHVKWMVTFLHTHHQGEDLLVCPKLLERGPAEIDPQVHTMEAQHAGLAKALDALSVKETNWRETSAARATKNSSCSLSSELRYLAPSSPTTCCSNQQELERHTAEGREQKG